MSLKYKIEDWAGNVLDYTGLFKRTCVAVPMEFDSFDSAWEYIYENFDETYYEEFEVSHEKP